jgi:hypothetical protein
MARDDAGLVAENRILMDQLKGRVLLSDSEKNALPEIGQRLGPKALADVATAANTVIGLRR